MRFVEILVVAVCLLLMLGTESDASEGNIRGKVTDQKTGDPMVGASVTVKETTVGTKTAADGRFLISDISPGTYTLVITAAGYITVEMSDVEVKASQTIERNLQMKSLVESIRELQTVKGRIPETPEFNKAWLEKIKSDSTNIHQKQCGKIMGTLTDKKYGDAVFGAAVKLKGSASRVLPDIYGNYVIPNVLPGTYTLVVRGLGYATIELPNVEVKADSTTIRNFEMIQIPIDLKDAKF